MVARPARALLESRNVGSIIVLCQAPARLTEALPRSERISIRRSAGTIAQTMLELIRDPTIQWPLLVTTADHALLDPPTVEEFCASAAGSDIAIGVVERTDLLRRLPDSRRTWLKFRGGSYTGANLFALASPRVAPAIEQWRSVEQGRKKGWRIIGLLGPVLLLGVMLRLLTLEQVLVRAGRRLNLSLKPVRLSNPLAGVDVDKMSDHALAQSIIEGKR